MFAFQIRDAFKSFLIKENRHENLMILLTALARKLDEMRPELVKLGTDANASSVHGKMHEVLQALKVVRSTQALSSLDKLEEDLKLLPRSNNDFQPWDKLLFELERFRELFDTYITSHNASIGAEISFTANDILSNYGSLKGLFQYWTSLTNKNSDAKKNEQDFKIYFPDTQDLESILAKLSAIQNLYSFGCQIAEIDPHDFPIVLIDAEVGSFWAWMRGHGFPLVFLSWALTHASIFLNSITEDGQIQTSKNRVELMKSIVELRDSMDTESIHKTNLDEVIFENIDRLALELKKVGSIRGVQVNNASISGYVQLIEAPMRANQQDTLLLPLIPPDKNH